MKRTVVNDDILNERKSDENARGVGVVTEKRPEGERLLEAVLGEKGLRKGIQKEVEKERNRRDDVPVSDLVEEGVVRDETLRAILLDLLRCIGGDGFEFEISETTREGGGEGVHSAKHLKVEEQSVVQVLEHICLLRLFMMKRPRNCRMEGNESGENSKPLRSKARIEHIGFFQHLKVGELLLLQRECADKHTPRENHYT